jgi:3-hydroxyisobutyrate dehydrogenase-like beta-hydroxyacid dehydrogenase
MVVNAYARITRYCYSMQQTNQDHGMDVGFIGLGHMGSPMALNLIKSGQRLIVYNRTRSRAELLGAQGARIADDVAEACRGEAVITMLADDAAVELVVFGAGGILSALPKNGIHVSMSTISVALSDRLALAHRRVEQRYVAAPVFGRPEAAAARKLFIIAAGPDAALARCRILFDAMGQKTFQLGERQSQANLVKLAGNFLIAANIECLGEAFALARKSGIDPHCFLEVLTGSLFSAPLYQTYGTIIAQEKYEPAGFKMSLALKDIRLALAAADATAVPMPAASLVHDHYLAGVAQGRAEADWSELARLCARNAGL